MAQIHSHSTRFSCDQAVKLIYRGRGARHLISTACGKVTRKTRRGTVSFACCKRLRKAGLV